MKYNPFNPNSVVAPNLFAGRTQQVLNVCKKLSIIKYKMPASFFVFGERGIGKTALVKLIKSVAEANDEKLGKIKMLTSYYLVENGQDIGSVLEESINRLTDQMSQGVIDRLGKRLGDLFKNGKFSLGIYGVNAGVALQNDQKKNITIKDQSVAILSSIIKALNEENNQIEGKKKEEGVLIVIDEIHNLKEKEKVASVLRNIITTLDVEGLGSISFLLVGYKEDKDIFFGGDPSAHRTFDTIPLETMPDNEASEVLKKGFTQAEINFDASLMDKNISVAGGYPHSLQILGHKLVETDTDDNIRSDDWKNAIVDTSMELRTKEFSRMYSFGKKRTIKDKIIDFLAEKNKPVSKKDLQKKFENCNIYQYITTLKKTGAVKEVEEGKIALQSQLFRTAILVEKYIRKISNKQKFNNPQKNNNNNSKS